MAMRQQDYPQAVTFARRQLIIDNLCGVRGYELKEQIGEGAYVVMRYMRQGSRLAALQANRPGR
jgi:hypothetical protein